jgi:hypothetical protein
LLFAGFAYQQLILPLDHLAARLLMGILVAAGIVAFVVSKRRRLTLFGAALDLPAFSLLLAAMALWPAAMWPQELTEVTLKSGRGIIVDGGSTVWKSLRGGQMISFHLVIASRDGTQRKYSVPQDMNSKISLRRTFHDEAIDPKFLGALVDFRYDADDYLYDLWKGGSAVYTAENVVRSSGRLTQVLIALSQALSCVAGLFVLLAFWLRHLEAKQSGQQKKSA